MTGHTCGLACWTARENICRCSCGGVNHGCLRTESGEQPVRSRKIQGQFYELSSVCEGYGQVNEMHMNHTMPQDSIRKTATKREIAEWPELKAYRERSQVDLILKPIVLIWARSTKYS